MSRFRPQYRELSTDEKNLVGKVKDQAEALAETIELIAQSQGADRRCTALAMTNLEQAVMWAVKGVTA